MLQGIKAQTYLKDFPLKAPYQNRENLQGTLVAQGSDFQIQLPRHSEATEATVQQ